MTDREAKEILLSIKNDNNFGCSIQEALQIAIKSLEKKDKIKEAFETWKSYTGGFYGADDETIILICTLKRILSSDEE